MQSKARPRQGSKLDPYAEHIDRRIAEGLDAAGTLVQVDDVPNGLPAEATQLLNQADKYPNFPPCNCQHVATSSPP